MNEMTSIGDLHHERRRIAQQFARDTFREAVLRAFKSDFKVLASKWLYDNKGSDLFDQICAWPDYYIPATKTALLRAHAGDIGEKVGAGQWIVELGAGASVKVRALIEGLPKIQGYMPVDISAEYLEEAAGRLKQSYPWLPISTLVADFTLPLALPSFLMEKPVLVFMPGSTLCTFMRGDMERFLSYLSEAVPRGSHFLCGVDLKKGKSAFQRAYNNPPMRAFNFNFIERVNRELGGTLDLDNFQHEARYNVESARVEVYLVSTCHQRFLISGEEIELQAGDEIQVERSHKYEAAEFQLLAAENGWLPQDVYVDDERLFSVHLLQSI